MLAWLVLPLDAWIVSLGTYFVTFAIGFVGGDPSVIPAYASLGVAIAVALVIDCSAAWLVSRNEDDGPNRFGDAPR